MKWEHLQAAGRALGHPQILSRRNLLQPADYVAQGQEKFEICSCKHMYSARKILNIYREREEFIPIINAKLICTNTSGSVLYFYKRGRNFFPIRNNDDDDDVIKKEEKKLVRALTNNRVQANGSQIDRGRTIIGSWTWIGLDRN